MADVFLFGFTIVFIWALQSIPTTIINVKKGVEFPYNDFKKFLYLTFLPYVLYCLAIKKKPHQW